MRNERAVLKLAASRARITTLDIPSVNPHTNIVTVNPVTGRGNPNRVGGHRRKSGFFVSVRPVLPLWRSGRGSFRAGRCQLPVFPPPLGLPPTVESGW